MNKAICKIISDFKSKSVSVMAIEKKLGFSNGMIGKASKGKYAMGTQKMNALLEYHAAEFPDSKEEVENLIKSNATPEYKEGGLYRWVNGRFESAEGVVFDGGVPTLDLHRNEFVNMDESKGSVVLEKCSIEFKETTPKSYDNKDLKAFILDESGATGAGYPPEPATAPTETLKPKVDLSAMKEEISRIESEKCPPYMNASQFRKSQAKRISALKAQLL